MASARLRARAANAYAAMLYTQPPWTKNLDIWVEPARDNALRVLRALAAFGSPTALTAEELARAGLILQIGVPLNRIDLITALEALSFADAWTRKRAFTFSGVPVHVLDIDDLITNKRAVARPRTSSTSNGSRRRSRAASSSAAVAADILQPLRARGFG